MHACMHAHTHIHTHKPSTPVHVSIKVPKKVDVGCSMCTCGKLLVFLYSVRKAVIGWLDGPLAVVFFFFCIVLSVTYLKCSWYCLSSLPLVWHFLFIVTLTHTHAHTKHTHTHGESTGAHANTHTRTRARAQKHTYTGARTQTHTHTPIRSQKTCLKN